MLSRRGLSLSWLAYLFFVVYGSLVPLDFKPLPFDAAVVRFEHIRWLEIGVQGRADWVANAVLYLPLGFMSARLFGGHAGRARLSGWTRALAFCIAVAFGVEFAQLFFPPRTVSQNDLLAEAIGSAIGVVLAPLLQPWVARIRRGWVAGGSRLGVRLLEVYAVGYVALAFFPYDLLLSWQELQGKVETGNWGWLLAAHPRGLLFSLLLLLVEVVLTMPFGVLLALRRRAGKPAWIDAALVGLLLGLLVEGGQFFFETGVSQGLSVLTRVVGVVAGALMWPRLVSLGVDGMRRVVRRCSSAILLAYLPVLAFVNGWSRGAWRGPAAAAVAWAEVRLLPFYYHYYTSEAKALYSLGSVVLMYLPVAAIGWAYRLRGSVTAAVAGSLAFGIEASKVFIAGEHPDPTNVLIAAATCAIVLKLSEAPARPPAAVDSPPADFNPAPWVAAIVLPLAAAWAWTLPAFALALLGLFAVCGIAVWWRPVLAIAIIPAAMPVLDLAPWTGRFFLDAFDLLSAVCLAIAFVRTRPESAGARRPNLLTLAFLVLGLSFGVSTLRALWPLQPLDGNSFASYDSPYNALRIVKGAAWAWLFVGVYRRVKTSAGGRAAVFGAGMTFGLLLTVACILWERATFVGLFDFASVYRVSGPFSAMHKGGAYVECYLVMASAFVAVAAIRARHRWASAAAVLLLAGAGYAVAVTYSRNGYAAMALMLVVALVIGVRKGGWRRDAAIGGAVLVVVVAAVAPVVAGSFARERLSRSANDLGVRVNHWADALSIRSEGWATSLFGEGVGRFPDLHYWRSREPVHAGSYRLERAGSKAWLRLGPGATLYIEQIVDPAPGADLVLSADLRSPLAPATLAVALCEKWLLTSIGCDNEVATANGKAGAWQHAEVHLRAPESTGAPWPFRPLVKLALLTPAAQTTIDIARLRLRTAAGQDLVSNGDFKSGLDRWFFATDVDPPWHIHSLPVSVLFDQGWFGVLAWTCVLVAALGRGVRLARDGRAQAAALAAVAGFLVCASVNTLLDAPRFLWLLLVLVWLAATANDEDAPDRRHPPLPLQPPGRGRL
jgi:VanZ family protein